MLVLLSTWYKEFNAIDFAQKNNTLFMKTSALEALNVDNAFTQLHSHIYRCVKPKKI